MAINDKGKHVPFKPIHKIERIIKSLGWQKPKCLSNGCMNYELDTYLQKQFPDSWEQIKALLKMAKLMVYRESGDL